MGLTIVQTLLFVIGIYKWIVIAMVIFSWLYAFNVVNNSNRFVAMVGEFLYKATEPALRPIRRILPDLGGLDISPSFDRRKPFSGGSGDSGPSAA